MGRTMSGGLGYFQTPNVDVPLNNREKGQIADVAKDQLKVWQEAAWEWNVKTVIRHGRECNICGVCRQNIWFTADPKGIVYKYSTDEIVALIVSHIRQLHSSMVGGLWISQKSKQSFGEY
jgi:hypothetical protein